MERADSELQPQPACWERARVYQTRPATSPDARGAMTGEASRPFEIPLSIQPEDIDELGHVNNVVYVRWIQEAAVAHWRALTTSAQREDLAWVVVRHEIDYRRPALPGDRILARTWVGPATRTSFERRTEILRGEGAEVLVRARTLWCPVDPLTGRLRAVSAEVRALVSSGDA